MKDFWDKHAAAVASLLTEYHLAVIDRCGDVSGKRILELGCGLGAMARECAARGAKVTAVDFSEGMIARAQTLEHGDQVDFKCSDVIQMDLGERFDLIIGCTFLHETPEAQFGELLDVIDRHLADGGRVIFHENSFFNIMFRLVRRNLVDRGVLRKLGSYDETPFDKARFDLMRERFPGTIRRVDVFCLFSRIAWQFMSHKRRLGWTYPVGVRMDHALNRLRPGSRTALYWSYTQMIIAKR